MRETQKYPIFVILLERGNMESSKFKETYKSPACKTIIVKMNRVLCQSPIQSQTEETTEEDLF